MGVCATMESVACLPMEADTAHMLIDTLKESHYNFPRPSFYIPGVQLKY
jgi:hypothetical protein